MGRLYLKTSEKLECLLGGFSFDVNGINRLLPNLPRKSLLENGLTKTVDIILKIFCLNIMS